MCNSPATIGRLYLRVSDIQRILLVCLGNICRSPTAECVLRHVAAQTMPSLALHIESAGTADYHVGRAADPRSVRAALNRDIDLSAHRARQIGPADFSRFDIILAMDRSNLRDLEARRPALATASLGLFMTYAIDNELLEVPDPFYGGAADFERVLDLTTSASRGLIAALAKH
jgi:protein-tyrosine phosphatase